jgi:hypothetical protein
MVGASARNAVLAAGDKARWLADTRRLIVRWPSYAVASVPSIRLSRTSADAATSHAWLRGVTGEQKVTIFDGYVAGKTTAETRRIDRLAIVKLRESPPTGRYIFL